MPAVRAVAASVPYAGAVGLSAASSAGHSDFGGELLADRSVPFLVIDSRFDAEYDLTLHNFVVREAGTGTLDFYYGVTNDSDLPVRLADMDTGRFTRSLSVDPIDVRLRDDPRHDYAPFLADRTRSHFGGVTLDFPAGQTLGPGESSGLFFIRTAATRFELAGLTQFRSSPDLSSDDGFALTFNPVLDGALVPPPTAQVSVPVPPVAPVAAILILIGIGVTERLRRAGRPI